MKIKILLIFAIVILCFSFAFFIRYSFVHSSDDKIKIMLKDVTEHYNKFVKIEKDTNIYDENNNLIGKIYKNTKAILEEQELKFDTQYFYIKNIGYIYYKDVSPINELNKNYRYKKYIPYNENIITKDNYTLYDSDGSKLYNFNKSNSYPILINNYDDKYYIEFNDELLYILNEDVEKTVYNQNTDLKNAENVTTLCYHRVYNTNEECTYEQLCKSQSNFDKEMRYLYDEDYLSLTMEEMYLYNAKKLQIPQKSILITLDDGKLISSAIEILEKYNLHATVFIITGSFDDYDAVKSSSLELQSHTNDMHTTGICPIQKSYQQGGGILCLDEDKILDDLTKSKNKLNGAIALAYPFYDYNDRATSLVEKAGFKLAFIGAATTDGRSNINTNPYKIPRMTIWDTTTFDEFKKIVTN